LDNMEEVRLKWRQLQLEQDDDVQLLQLWTINLKRSQNCYRKGGKFEHIVVAVVEKREKENQALEEASWDEKKRDTWRNRWVDLTLMVVTTMIIKVDASEEEIICLNTLLVFFC
jgi:hypothetical protein